LVTEVGEGIVNPVVVKKFNIVGATALEGRETNIKVDKICK